MTRIADSFADRQTDGYNIISLGFFCSVASELERTGIRDSSYPFDWLISGDFHSVLSLIENHFDGFAERQNLYQEFNISPAYYFNKVCNVHFYHDISPYQSLDRQYDAFRAKYLRRIERFYEAIQSPTIFVRYCANREELDYIFEHQEEIRTLLKRFHPDNEIIYVSSDEGERLPMDRLYYVEKDRWDTVARTFFEKAPELEAYLVEHSALRKKIERNIKRYQRNERRKIVRKIEARLRKLFHTRAYHHDQQYEELLAKGHEP